MFELDRPPPAAHDVARSGAGLTEPFRDLTAWVDWFQSAPIPVYAGTAEAIEALRGREDDVDARMIADVVSEDPLMTLKLLVQSGATRPAGATADAETVTAALVLMGIGPFFRAFGRQPTVEDWFHTVDAGRAGLEAVMSRAHRAAKFALGFAVVRRDHDAAVIYEAALLHDFAEMLLWCHAPTLALEMRARQRVDATLRSSRVQLDCLNIELAELQQALMTQWRLPALLTRISDDRQAAHPSVRCVALAVALARHSAESWDNPAIADDLTQLSSLLNLSVASVRAMLSGLDDS